MIKIVRRINIFDGLIFFWGKGKFLMHTSGNSDFCCVIGSDFSTSARLTRPLFAALMLGPMSKDRQDSLEVILSEKFTILSIGASL